MGDVFEEFRPEALCHQATQMDVRRSVREPDFDAEVNIIGTIRLLENCVRYDVQKVVFASTDGAVYGEQREFRPPRTTRSTRSPLTAFRRLPGSITFTSTTSSTSYPTPFCATPTSTDLVRIRTARQGRSHLLLKPGAGKVSTINGTGEQTRDYVYVEDVARANVLALEGDAPSGAYNIGTGIETSVNELYESRRKIACKNLMPEHGPPKAGEQMRSSISPKRPLASSAGVRR